MVIRRVCEWCGKEFAAKTVRTRFCSDRCSKTAYKHNKRLEFVSNFNLEASIRKSQTMGRRKDTLCPLRAYTRSFRRTRCHHASSEARPTTACHMSQGSSPRERRKSKDASHRCYASFAFLFVSQIDFLIPNQAFAPYGRITRTIEQDKNSENAAVGYATVYPL